MRNQYLSRPDVQDYLSLYPDVTKEEKAELVKWLKQGYSPYCNDLYVVDDRAHLVDFIAAIRAEKEYCEEQWKLHRALESEKS